MFSLEQILNWIRRSLILCAVAMSVMWTVSLGAPDEAWRRTIDGWEVVAAWQQQPSQLDPPRTTHLHPAVVATFQMLASIWALLAFEGTQESTGREHS